MAGRAVSSPCAQPVQRRLGLVVRRAAEHQPLVRVLERHEHLEVRRGTPASGWCTACCPRPPAAGHRPPATGHNVSLVPQARELLVVGETCGEESGRRRVLRMCGVDRDGRRLVTDDGPQHRRARCPHPPGRFRSTTYSRRPRHPRSPRRPGRLRRPAPSTPTGCRAAPGCGAHRRHWAPRPSAPSGAGEPSGTRHAGCSTAIGSAAATSSTPPPCTDGSSERMLGEFTRDHRESLVPATKYTTLRRPGDPNSGGPHRKNLFASVEAGLRRLNTDYLDLLHPHVADFTTPVEEIPRGRDDLVRQGKVLCVAISNAPAAARHPARGHPLRPPAEPMRGSRAGRTPALPRLTPRRGTGGRRARWCSASAVWRGCRGARPAPREACCPPAAPRAAGRRRARHAGR